MTFHGYPTCAMLGDYLRAAAGFIPVTGVLVSLPVTATVGIVLGGFASLFALFGVRTMLRHGSRLEMTEAVLRATGLFPASIVWEELDRMRLSYYSTRRDQRNGWMQLELRSGSSNINLDSRIEGFSELVERSARAAQRRGLSLDAATLANLAVLGVSDRCEAVGREAAI